MKIIIIGLNWLGDIIMSVPAIMAAADVGEVHIITRPHLAEVYELLPIPLNIHAVATNAGIFSVIKSLKPLRKLKTDKALVLPDSLRAALIAKICKSAQSTGFATQMRSFFLDQAIAKPQNYKQLHESELHFMLVKKAGLSKIRPAIKATHFTEFYFTEVATKLGLSPDKPFITLAPGAAFGSAKRWPAEKFAQLATLLHENLGLPMVITASATENSLAETIMQSSQIPMINAAGKTSLKELACLLSKTRGLIANDSGTMHLGALFSTPTVVPVGPTDMTRTGPLNNNFRAVHPPDSICPLTPCRQRICPRKDHVCMQSIEAGVVYEEFIKLYKQNYE